MLISAKFSSTCPECQGPIVAGEQIEYRRGEKAVHPACYRRYFEIPIGGGKMRVFAATFEAAKAEAERLYATGCDAEYCPSPASCRKEHWHDVNCRCQSCMDLDDEASN